MSQMPGTVRKDSKSKSKRNLENRDSIRGKRPRLTERIG